MTPAVREIPSTLAGKIRYLKWFHIPVSPGAMRPPIGKIAQSSAKTRIHSIPKKNWGIETPIMPNTVSTLSPIDPFFSALRMPRMLPSTEEMARAARDSSSVAGKSWSRMSLMGTPLVME